MEYFTLRSSSVMGQKGFLPVLPVHSLPAYKLRLGKSLVQKIA